MNELLEVTQNEKCELAVLDRSGDTKTIWDPDNEDEVDIARETFRRLVAKGYAIFKVDKEGSKGVKMRDFDARAGKLIAVPAIVAG